MEKKEEMFEPSSDARFLAQALAKVEHGDTIDFAALSAAIGRDVRRFARGCLQTAVRMQLHEGRVFDNVRGVGYRLLTSSDVVKTQAAKGFQKISRVARRTTKKVSCAAPKDLTNSERIAQNTQLSMLGAVGHLSRPKSIAVLERHISDKNAELPIGDTLRFMTGS